jgi:hypothetical protein
MKKIITILTAAVLFISCQKEKTEPEFCEDGYIRWGGSLALDGIEWYFTKDLSGTQASYKMENLSADFEADSLAVNICLVKTDKTFTVFTPGGILSIYYINSIKRR